MHLGAALDLCAIAEVARWIGEGASRLPTRTKRRMPRMDRLGVRRRELSSVVERETAQTAG